jgi:hypothetical protein
MRAMNDPTIRVPYCASCGTLAAAGESFCRQCGKPVVAPTIAAQQTPPMPPPSQPGSRAPQSTVTAVSPQMPQMPQMPARPLNVGKKRRSPILLGCLVFLGLIVVVVAIGGIYLWRRSVYTAPERTAPAVPERAAGTMTEFPVDNDPTAPMTPESVQTEALGGTIAKTSTSSSSSTTKLPPGVDRSQLSKGATSMTTSVYRPKRATPATSTASSKDEAYVCVLTAMPDQPNFGDGLANSVVKASGGTKTGVRITSAAGAVYIGSKIQAAESIVYVLTKQGADIVILIYTFDPSNSVAIDRLAKNVGNGQGLLDYPEVKASLWTLPSTTPNGLTLVEINTITGQQIENSIASSSSSGNNDEVQKILSQMRPFIPDRLTGARYVDTNRGEWVTLTFEYGSTFAAWRTWLLARSALGLGGAESTDVREVNGVIMTQEGMRILVFQKGPYLIFVSSPSTEPKDRLVALGNQFQV